MKRGHVATVGPLTIRAEEGGTFPVSGGAGLVVGDEVLYDVVGGTPYLIWPAPEPIPLVNGAWQTPTLINGWQDWNAALYPARYMKDALGFVHLEGLVRNGTVNTNVYVLPVGFRPVYHQYMTSHGYTGSAYAESHWVVQPDGNVRHLSGGNTQVSMSGLTFLAEA